MTKIKSFSESLNKLYSPDKLEYQYQRFEKLIDAFSTRFQSNNVRLFSSPGRSEICGNHTDHNHGKVIAASINLDSIAVVEKTNNNVITILSEGFPEEFKVELTFLNPIENEKESTNALIRGIAARFKELDYNIGGFNAYITSDVLRGSGLSSSASIEVLIGSILNNLYNSSSIPLEQLAIIGQYAENVYFGKPCGLMDQMACAVGNIITIDFKDPGNPIVKKIDFNFEKENYKLVVVDTGGNHADLTDDYASIPNEMKSIAKAFNKDVCREINSTDLLAKITELRVSHGDRAVLRAFHFLQENKRVDKAIQSLEKSDFEEFLKMIRASGNSSFKWLQNIYTNKNITEQGITLALAITEQFLDELNIGACRVHGGGFAGTIQVFLPKVHVADYINLMTPIFGQNSVQSLDIRSSGVVEIMAN